jgi:hypothetical protein
VKPPLQLQGSLRPALDGAFSPDRGFEGPWPGVRARFDGADLVLARLTRRHPRTRARQALGPPQDGHVYPSATRIEGLGRLRTFGLVLALRRRLGRAVEVRRHGRDLVIRMGVPLDRLHSDELRLLMQHEHRFDPPLLLYEHGKVVVHVRARPGTDAADLLRRIPGLDARVVADVDVRPWAGLEPSIPDGRTSTHPPGWKP